MSNLALIIAIGLLGGMAIGLQAPLASLIGQRLGVLESVFFVHLGGLIAVAALLLFVGGGRLGQWQTVPPHAWLAGVMGVIGVGSTVFMVPRIGVATAITLIISGQLLIAAAIDHFGALGVEAKPISVDRVLGLGLVLLGAWWAMRR
jgi:transporter family-2 protein